MQKHIVVIFVFTVAILLHAVSAAAPPPPFPPEPYEWIRCETFGLGFGSKHKPIGANLTAVNDIACLANIVSHYWNSTDVIWVIANVTLGPMPRPANRTILPQVFFPAGADMAPVNKTIHQLGQLSFCANDDECLTLLTKAASVPGAAYVVVIPMMITSLGRRRAAALDFLQTKTGK